MPYCNTRASHQLQHGTYYLNNKLVPHARVHDKASSLSSRVSEPEARHSTRVLSSTNGLSPVRSASRAWNEKDARKRRLVGGSDNSLGRCTLRCHCYRNARSFNHVWIATRKGPSAQALSETHASFVGHLASLLCLLEPRNMLVNDRKGHRAAALLARVAPAIGAGATASCSQRANLLQHAFHVC